jgi:hypothetical protein
MTVSYLKMLSVRANVPFARAASITIGARSGLNLLAQVQLTGKK